MAEYDLVIRGGTVVPGTGVPRYRADVAVKDGRVAMISGRIPAGGAKEIDASGCIVGPGAVDLHTHYDAQLNWDPYATLSSWMGITSLTIGQCGFGFAPTKPEDRELNMLMMNRIEAIPLEAMRLGLRWDWETYPEYLDSLDRQGLGVNVGSLFPFSPLRGYVVGMLPARERRSVTESELNRMKELFYEGMKAGAFGFSADKAAEDRPDDGGYLPSHVASQEEFISLAEILGEFGVGHIGWTIGVPLLDDRKDLETLMTQMMKISGRQLHVNLGPPKDGLVWLEKARKEGLPAVKQQAIFFPEITFKLADYNFFDIYPSWVQPLVGSAAERAVKLRNPETRAAMKLDVEMQRDESQVGATFAARTDWRRMMVVEVARKRNVKYEGMTIAELAKHQNKHPLDAFLDLALDEDLETDFSHGSGDGPGDEKLAEFINSPYAHVSFSDGGAHTKYLTLAKWPIEILAHWVRDKEIMSLEQAHYKISAYPAWFADFKDRGTLRVGSWADIMIYELDKLGYLYKKPVYANDFPGGERRLIQKPTGLRYTLVNGTVTFADNICSGALPGKLLRSYDMVD